MAFAHDFLPRTPYGRVFDIPPARKIARPRFKTPEDRLAECEFGPTGRDPHYPSGWFIFPTLVIGAVILGFLL